MRHLLPLPDDIMFLQLLYPPSLINMWILAETHFRKSLILMRYMPLNLKRVNMSVFFLILKNRFLLMFFQIVKGISFKLLSKDPFRRTQKVKYACSDMYEVYRDVVHKVFPSCCMLLDYFHLSQDFHRKNE